MFQSLQIASQKQIQFITHEKYKNKKISRYVKAKGTADGEQKINIPLLGCSTYVYTGKIY